MICAGLWALACLMHAGRGNWVHLALLRFFMGSAETAATPANAKTIGEWFPKSEHPSPQAGQASVFPSVPCWPTDYLFATLRSAGGRIYVHWHLAMLWVVLWGRSITARISILTSAKPSWTLSAGITEPPPVQITLSDRTENRGQNKRFYGIAIPAFMAEPAWAVMSFWFHTCQNLRHGP